MKDQENPHYRRKYADLSAVVEAIRAPLAEHGLGFVQIPEITRVTDKEFAVAVTTVIIHESGQTLSGTVTMPVTETRPQAIGSAITYARRYGLSSMLGVVTKEEGDDDAEAAEGRAAPAPVARAPAAPRGGMKKSDELVLAARAKEIWKRAKAKGIDTDAKFSAWTLAVLGNNMPWDKWNNKDFEALEENLDKQETEDIPY